MTHITIETNESTVPKVFDGIFKPFVGRYPELSGQCSYGIQSVLDALQIGEFHASLLVIVLRLFFTMKSGCRIGAGPKQGIHLVELIAG
jgi:hypothetical protein